MTTQKTEIDILVFDEKQEEEEKLDFDTQNLSKYITDISIGLKNRIKALDLYYKHRGKEDTIETINKLCMMYEISGTRLLREYLYEICKTSIVDPFLKSICAQALWRHDERDVFGYQAVHLVYPELGDDIGTPYKIDFVKILMRNENFRDKAQTHFSDIINNPKIDCDFRYKTILSLEKVENYDLSYFIIQGCKTFINNVKNMTMYRILAGQYLLRKKEYVPETEGILLSFAKDTDLDYNLRADASDVLLQYGSEWSKEEARQVILHLGVGSRNVYNIYDNSQNVHSKDVEESVSQALDYLHTFEILRKNDIEIDFYYVEKKILKMIRDEKKALNIPKDSKYEKEDKIKVSLNRIVMDRAIYSKYNCSLINILLRVWTYLSGHNNEKEIKKRLLEELVDMSGTCSSGFASRLVNVISGFGDFSIKISWREQIVANLSGRLNARVRNMDDLDLQEKVMVEMTIPSSDTDIRKHFLKFFRENILSIREEMYLEFKDYITDTDFDLYFRSAIQMYETGEI